MKKRSYRAQNVNEVRWEEVADRVKERAIASAQRQSTERELSHVESSGAALRWAS